MFSSKLNNNNILYPLILIQKLSLAKDDTAVSIFFNENIWNTEVYHVFLYSYKLFLENLGKVYFNFTEEEIHSFCSTYGLVHNFINVLPEFNELINIFHFVLVIHSTYNELLQTKSLLSQANVNLDIVKSFSDDGKVIIVDLRQFNSIIFTSLDAFCIFITSTFDLFYSNNASFDWKSIAIKYII